MTKPVAVTISVRRSDDVLFGALSELAAAGKLVVHNARGEFACNSSSSHSIIILPKGTSVGSLSGAWSPDDGEFGWESFTLTDSASKLRYLAAMLAGSGETKGMAEQLRGHISTWGREDSVDHQSVINFPRDRFGAVDAGFISEFAELLCDDAVIVLGGNDNGGTHPLSSLPGAVELPTDFYGSWSIRRDSDASGRSWWVLFSREDGTKLRLEMTKKALAGTSAAPTKAQTPELVDIKVTDACPFEKDCGFCYMGSTVKGAKGDPEHVCATLAALSELGVFEVALGGGEPTTWPHLEEILNFANSVGVVPNFTSKNYGVLRRHPEWIELIGSVAFSVNDRAGLNKLMNEISQLSYEARRKVSIQTIPEIVDTKLFSDIVAAAAGQYVRLTLLGYKSTGRGGEFTGRIERPSDYWIAICAQHEDMRLAIDTVLAEQCEQSLLAAGVPDWSFSTVEGAFSMYIDAVAGKAGPSSYVDPSVLDTVDLSQGVESLAQDIGSLFATY
jgi:hypothetical protein